MDVVYSTIRPSDHRLSHSYNASMAHVVFPTTRQTLRVAVRESFTLLKTVCEADFGTLCVLSCTWMTTSSNSLICFRAGGGGWGGGIVAMQSRSSSDHRPSHPYNAWFSHTRQALRAPRGGGNKTRSHFRGELTVLVRDDAPQHTDPGVLCGLALCGLLHPLRI